MRVELFDYGQGEPELMFDDETERDVIGKSDTFPGRFKTPIFEHLAHAQNERPAQAESGAAGGEPKADLFVPGRRMLKN